MHILACRNALLLGVLLAAWGPGCSDDEDLADRAAKTCAEDCRRQAGFCPSLDLSGCEGLCTCVVSTIEDDPRCLELALDQWTCDLGGEWTCAPGTDLVGAPVDPDRCAAQVEAFARAGCQRSCAGPP